MHELVIITDSQASVVWCYICACVYVIYDYPVDLIQSQWCAFNRRNNVYYSQFQL